MVDYNDELYGYLKLHDVEPEEASKIFKMSVKELTEMLLLDDSLSKSDFKKDMKKLHANGY